MSQTVTVACADVWSLKELEPIMAACACDVDAVFSKFDKQLQLVEKNASWYVAVNEIEDQKAMAEEYASNDDLDEMFRCAAGAMRYFLVRFNSVHVVRSILCGIAREVARRGEVCWIDTDYGWVIQASDFLKRIEANGTWDWRARPSDRPNA